MAELVKMSDQFQGLPMDNLIGGPLTAACNSQVMLAKATQDFITEVGLEKDANGKSTVRMVDFTFSKPEQIEQADGSVTLEKAEYNITVPFISIVAIPTLQIDTVDVSFNMEVKSSFSEATKDDRKAAFEAEGGGSIGPFKVSVKVSGSISSSKETQRSSDNSAKYEVRVTASQAGTPEGLSRALDIVQQSIAPVPTDTATEAIATR